MASVFSVKYAETINGDDGDPCRTTTVAAKDAEAAIAKVRKSVVGTHWDDTIDDEKRPGKTKKIRYTIDSIAIIGVERVTDLDIA